MRHTLLVLKLKPLSFLSYATAIRVNEERIFSFQITDITSTVMTFGNSSLTCWCNKRRSNPSTILTRRYFNIVFFQTALLESCLSNSAVARQRSVSDMQCHYEMNFTEFENRN